MRWLTAILGIAAAGAAPAGRAADPPPAPDLDFLEYLGSWQAEDEEWVLTAEWEHERVPEVDAKPEPETQPKRNDDE
jgi:hypothetical protein